MGPAFGLYTHIRANRVRSCFLIAGLFVLVYLLVFAGALVGEVLVQGDAPLDELLGAAWRDLAAAVPIATAATAIWIAIAWKFHQKLIDLVTGGHTVTRQEQPDLYNLLENLCVSRGMAMPRLKVIDTPARNAFATGLNDKQYAISVTTGLLAALEPAEIEAVLAHELTHIRNGDVRLMVIAGIIAGVIGFFAELFFRVFFRSGWRVGGGSRRTSSSDRKGGGAIPALLIAVVVIAIAWFLSVVIRFALSRSREFLADAGAVELTKNADAMIGALRKIENRGELAGATSAVMEMCVDNPRSGFADLFATHPSIDSRVEALVRYAGGHDPGPLPPPGDEAAAEGEALPGDQGEAAPSASAADPSAIGPWGARRTG